MLFIEVKGLKDLGWHVGEPNPIQPYLIREVQSVQADGDELTYILVNISNIPRTVSSRVMSWFGDDAKFIVANLPWPNSSAD